MASEDPVRLRDIAERLDLAEITVSKALRDHPDIASDTKERIKRAARDMGYVPNLVARSLSSGRTRTLGVVVPEIAHTFFGAVLSGVHQRADEAGFDIVLTVSEEDAELEAQHIETLLGMRVDGLLVSTSQEEPVREVYRLAEQRGVPLVFFDRRLEERTFPSVTNDNRAMARTLTDHAIGEGYERIAHVAGPNEVPLARKRLEGFLAAHETRNRSVREEYVVETGFDRRAGSEGAEQLLDLEVPPEVVLTVSVPAAMGFLDVLEERSGGEGLETVRVMTFGHWSSNVYFSRGFFLAGIDQRPRVIGRRSTELLIDLIEDRQDGPRHVTVGFDLVTADRSSRPSPPRSPNRPSRSRGTTARPSERDPR